MDRLTAIEQLHQLGGDVELRRVWLDGDSAVVEFIQAGVVRLLLVDDGGPRLFQNSPAPPAGKAVAVVAAVLGGTAFSAVALFSMAGGALATGKALGLAAVGALAIGAFAVGSMAIGALAVGAVALGKVAVGKLMVKEAHLKRVVIEELVVNRESRAD